MESLATALPTLGEAWGLILQSIVLGYLPPGVVIGLAVGIFPCLGGITGLSLLLPCMCGIDPILGLALMIGMVAVLAGRLALKELAVAELGLMIGTIGIADVGGSLRMTTYDIPYLTDGLQLVIVGLGVFAVPEIVSLLRQNRSIVGPLPRPWTGLTESFPATGT